MNEKKAPPTAEEEKDQPDVMAERKRIACKFGNVSFGEEKAGAQIGFSRGQFANVQEADRLLTKAQLACRLQGDTPLFKKPFDAIVETGRLSLDRESMYVRLSFKMDTIDRGDLACVAKAQGEVLVHRIGDAGQFDEEEEADDDEAEGQMTMDE